MDGDSKTYKIKIQKGKRITVNSKALLLMLPLIHIIKQVLIVLI